MAPANSRKYVSLLFNDNPHLLCHSYDSRATEIVNTLDTHEASCTKLTQQLTDFPRYVIIPMGTIYNTCINDTTFKLLRFKLEYMSISIFTAFILSLCAGLIHLGLLEVG